MALKNKTHDIDKASIVKLPPQIERALNEHEHHVNAAVALKRATSAPPSALMPADILALQRAIGNRAVQRILHNQPDGTPTRQSATSAHTIQRQPEGEEPLQQKSEPARNTENKTGLPGGLKAGIEKLSGLSMDDVKVHLGSPAPAEVQAAAFTRGTDIHLGPEGEQHLAHEAWHVVQQKQGRVKPTLQSRGVAINNDQGLEREADVMGLKALQMKVAPNPVMQFPGGQDVKSDSKAAPAPTAAPAASADKDKKGDKKDDADKSKKAMTSKQVLKWALYKGTTYTAPKIRGFAPPGPLMMKGPQGVEKIGNLPVHFTLYQANVDQKDFNAGTAYTYIRDKVFGGGGYTCHHITQERVNLKGDERNARYFKSGEWYPGNIPKKDEDSTKALMEKALLKDERDDTIIKRIKLGEQDLKE